MNTKPSPSEQIKAATAVIPDFPKPGVSFIDITTVLKNPNINSMAILTVGELFDPGSYDVVVSPGSRGWLLGQPIALLKGKPFIPIREPEKLPRKTAQIITTSEYNKEKILALHRDDIKPGARVLIVDDVLATCGTAMAIVDCLTMLGAKVVGIAALYDLLYIPARSPLPCPVSAVVAYTEPPEAYMPPEA